MTGSGHPPDGHVETRDYGGPGDYVQAAYDGALRSGGHSAALAGLNFFSSGFGKGILVIAAAVVAVGIIGGAMAASGGTLSVVGAGGVMVNATVGQGIMVGLIEGLGTLFSTGGAIAMIVGGIAGAALDGKRHPPEMQVEQAQALADQYKQNREQVLSPTPTLAVSQEKPQAQPVKNELAKNEMVTEKDCEPCFAARERQRRIDAATAERKVG